MDEWVPSINKQQLQCNRNKKEKKNLVNFHHADLVTHTLYMNAVASS